MPERKQTKTRKRATGVTDSARDLRSQFSPSGSHPEDEWYEENMYQAKIPHEASMKNSCYKLSRQRTTADRLFPFHPQGPTSDVFTLADASRRQNALSSLRSKAQLQDDSGHYYCTTLQSEVLDASLQLKSTEDCPKLEVKSDPLLLHFRRPRTDQSVQREGSYGLHPLEDSQLARAVGRSSEAIEPRRQFAKSPYKILDAPNLKDDFYYNLIHWSSKNVLGVGLGEAVYVWTAATSAVEELNGNEAAREEISSLCWSQGASALAVGSRRGLLQLWDPETKTKLIDLKGHTSRIGCLSWNIDMLASGCRDGSIRYYDHRASNPVDLIKAHQSEVCGLQWSTDNQHLISGGNDNQVHVWDIRKPQTSMWRIAEHKAAIKALTWSPHNCKHFASGGGLKDLSINVDTGAQVCGLHWSQNVDEIVSTHGYNSNAIKIWRARNMENLTTIPGHSTRIVYMTTSPDGTSIATGAGDESIRFFFLFPPSADRMDPDLSRRAMGYDMVR